MTRLTQALEALAESGTSRGHDAVLAAARSRASNLRRQRLVAMGGVAVVTIAIVATAGVAVLRGEDVDTVESGLAATPSTDVGPSPTDASPPPPAPATTSEVAPSTAPPGEGTVVDVFFLVGNPSRCTETQGVERRVEGTAVLRGALDALLRGPSETERAAGLTSSFSAATAGGLRSVEIVDGVALVDLRADVLTAMPGVSTSCGSSALLAQLDTTVTQFDGVERAVYSLDGDVAAFYGSLESVAPDGSHATPEADGLPAWPGAVSLEPSGALGIGDFPEYLARVDPRGALNVEAVASLLLHLEDERARGTVVLVASRSVGEGARSVAVTLTNLGDDSIAEVRYEVRLDVRPGRPATVTAGSWAQRCQPGRGHQDLRPELCV